MFVCSPFSSSSQLLPQSLQNSVPRNPKLYNPVWEARLWEAVMIMRRAWNLKQHLDTIKQTPTFSLCLFAQWWKVLLFTEYQVLKYRYNTLYTSHFIGTPTRGSPITARKTEARKLTLSKVRSWLKWAQFRTSSDSRSHSFNRPIPYFRKQGWLKHSPAVGSRG